MNMVTLAGRWGEGLINMASGQRVAIADVARRLARLLGGEELLVWGARPPEQNNPPRLVADVTHLKQDVGFEDFRDSDPGLTQVVA